MGYRASHEICLGSNETVSPERQNSLVYRLKKGSNWWIITHDSTKSTQYVTRKIVELKNSGSP